MTQNTTETSRLAGVDVSPSTAVELVRMDARGRVNISTFKPRGDLFMVQCHDDGTIVLVPATVMPAQQAHELMALRQSAMTAAPAVTDPPADSLPTVDPRMAAGLSVDLSQP